jgi:hypothetical protein
MLKENAQSRSGRPFMPPACLHPYTDAADFSPGMFWSQCEAVGWQRVQLDGQWSVRSLMRAWIAARSLGTRVTRSGRS